MFLGPGVPKSPPPKNAPFLEGSQKTYKNRTASKKYPCITRALYIQSYCRFSTLVKKRKNPDFEDFTKISSNLTNKW